MDYTQHEHDKNIQCFTKCAIFYHYAPKHSLMIIFYDLKTTQFVMTHVMTSRSVIGVNSLFVKKANGVNIGTIRNSD